LLADIHLKMCFGHLEFIQLLFDPGSQLFSSFDSLPRELRGIISKLLFYLNYF